MHTRDWQLLICGTWLNEPPKSRCTHMCCKLKYRMKRRSRKDSGGEGARECDSHSQRGCCDVINYCCTVLEWGFSHVSERDLSLLDDHPVSEESCQSASGTQWPHNLNRATQTVRLENSLSRIWREKYLEGVTSKRWSYEPNTFTRVKTTCCKGTN